MCNNLENGAPIPAEQPPKSPNIEHNPESKNPPNPPSVPTAENRPPHKTNPEPNKEKVTKWEIFERCIRVAEFVAFIAAIATAVFIGYQWHEMVKSSKIAEGQLRVMQGQLDEMKRTRISDERAWITANAIGMEVNGTNVSFKVSFKNTGKTPAMNATIWIAGSPNIHIITDFNPPSQSETYGILTPDSSVEFSTMPISINSFRSPNNGSHWYVGGIVRYKDIFNFAHWTRFCSETTDYGKSFGGTPYGNSCDDVETNQSD